MLRKALHSAVKLHGQPRYNMINPKRGPFSKDLDKYEILIVGANLGGILSSHLDAVFHGHHTIYIAFDEYINQQYPLRTIYEQQRASRQDYSPNAKMAMNMYMAHSEQVGVKTFQPQKNKVILQNGREIEYDHLVCAMGLVDDTDSIKGITDAWKDVDHPVFMPKDYLGWKAEEIIPPRFVYSYRHGNAFFYIPPYPLSGDIEGHNYFLADRIWRWKAFHGLELNFDFRNCFSTFKIHNCQC